MMFKRYLLRLRDDRYTGENRCQKCTALNLCLVMAASIAIYLYSRVLSVLFIMVSLSVIYLKGYVVPGTPVITKKYAPQAVMRYFDGKNRVDDRTEDAESVLRRYGVLTTEKASGEVRLTNSIIDGFRRQGSTTNSISEDQIRGILGAGEYQVDIREISDAAVAINGGDKICQWPSIAAVNCDIAARNVLEAQIGEWNQFSPRKRGLILRSFRSLIKDCPKCQSENSIGTSVQSSCCSSKTVLTVECEICQSNFVEVTSPQ